MAITQSFNPSDPLGSADPKTLDTIIQAFKALYAEALYHGGHKHEQTGPSTDSERGRHMCADAAMAAATGITAGEFRLYAADGSTVIVTLCDSTHGTTPSSIQAPTIDLVVDDVTADTVAATTSVTGPNVTSADSPGHTHTGTIVIPLPATGTGRVAGVIFENRGVTNMTLLGAKLVAFTAPSGSALDVDINILAAAYSDPTAAGTSILGTHPTIAAGSRVGTEITSFNDATLEPGEAWVFDVDALNSAADIVLILKARKA